jgi:hypothetical protein
MPDSRGFRDQRKHAVPVDTAGAGSGRHRLAALKRARAAPGRGTGPPAERSQRPAGGGVKPRFTINSKKSGRTLVRVIFAREGSR